MNPVALESRANPWEGEIPGSVSEIAGLNGVPHETLLLSASPPARQGIEAVLGRIAMTADLTIHDRNQARAVHAAARACPRAGILAETF